MSAKVSRKRKNSVLVLPADGKSPLLVTSNAVSSHVSDGDGQIDDR